MHLEDPKLQIVLILTFGFAFASLLGYITQRMKLSPILGYLLAGYLIGPYSPGFVADLHESEQLAEIGVILMMFGVGLHFKLDDLIKVKNIAIPGSIIQTLIAAICGALFIYSQGWTIESGIIVGLAIAVASTVVLVRILSDHHILHTIEGHIAVGWLVVEDVLTVIALLTIPILAESLSGTELSFGKMATSFLITLLKFAALIGIVFTLGRKAVTWVLFASARTRSSELFTLSVLALTFVIATASAIVFGTSIALGAFIAGMVIGQTHVRHQASSNALPLKEAFVVIFFLTVGMLFNPSAIVENFTIFLGVLAIILIIKPLTAFLIVFVMRYPLKTAFTIAFSLAQIGEFSFILSEEALKYKILPDTGYDIIVACAIASISINPLLFKVIDYLTVCWEKKGNISSVLKRNVKDLALPKAIVVGFGPIGQGVTRTLEQLGFRAVIIDLNVDTITKLIEEKREAVYGDASHRNILESAQIDNAHLLVITSPDIASTLSIIEVARHLKQSIPILARVRYVGDRHLLEELKVNFICCEEEAKNALNEALHKIVMKI